MHAFAGTGEGSLTAMHTAAVCGKDIPCQIPFERWSIEAAYDPTVAIDKMYVRQAGFIDGVENFDASVFRQETHGHLQDLCPYVSCLVMLYWESYALNFALHTDITPRY